VFLPASRARRAGLSRVHRGDDGFQPTFAVTLGKSLRTLGFQGVQHICPVPAALPQELRTRLGELGLQTVEARTWTGPVGWNAGGDNPVDKVYRMTFERLRERVTKLGLLSDEEVDQFFADIRSPDFQAMTGIHCAAWGRKPA